jgi:hypothetical protein
VPPFHTLAFSLWIIVSSTVKKKIQKSNPIEKLTDLKIRYIISAVENMKSLNVVDCK